MHCLRSGHPSLFHGGIFRIRCSTDWIKKHRGEQIWLVGGLEHELYDFHILGIIIPTDFHMFQRGWNHQPDEQVMELCYK